VFKSLRSCASVLAIMAIAMAGSAGVAGAASGGNSANAKLCQKGGSQSFVRADGTPLKNGGECTSSAAQGGTLIPAKSSSQALCESYGGTFGHDNQVIGVAYTLVLWTCNDVPLSDYDVAITTIFGNLRPACLADGGADSSEQWGPWYPATLMMTCGTPNFG
jgi:hypothetical protein